MSSDAGPMWGQLILLLVLIAVNAYFAAAEIAIDVYKRQHPTSTESRKSWIWQENAVVRWRFPAEAWSTLSNWRRNWAT